MKVLVFAHQLDIGGTLVNAIELSASLRASHGCDVLLFASPGPTTDLVQQAGLRFAPAPFARFTPSPSRMTALRDLVKREKPDIIHAWESWPCLDAFYAVTLPTRVPLLVTDMQMTLTNMLPRGTPITFGTPALVEQSRSAGHRRAQLLLPPVDTNANARHTFNSARFRQQYGIRESETVVVTVSRLDGPMKGDSLMRTVDAVDTLASESPLTLVIVGDGALRECLQNKAERVNTRLKRRVVILTGALLDPRPAYEAADIIIGMGTSALRGMAFEKPVIVTGERGFSALFTPETSRNFYFDGMYGVGNGDPGNNVLLDNIRQLLACANRWPSLGKFSRDFVVRHFSRDRIAAQLMAYFEDAVKHPPTLRESAIDGIRTAAVYTRERRFLMRSTHPQPANSEQMAFSTGRTTRRA